MFGREGGCSKEKPQGPSGRQLIPDMKSIARMYVIRLRPENRQEGLEGEKNETMTSRRSVLKDSLSLC